MNMKKIHYCWFGGKELPEYARANIESWKKYAPDYEIIEWNEKNFNLQEHKYAEDAFKSGKMAYVSDYVRFWVLREYGGIYMDVGTELIKPIRPLEESIPFAAIEGFSNTVNSGLIVACDKNDAMIDMIVRKYDATEYIDDDLFRKNHTVNHMWTDLLNRYGYVREDRTQKIQNWTFFSSDFFNPIYGFGGFKIKKNTYAIHHYSASWKNAKERKKDRLGDSFSFFCGRCLGDTIARIIVEFQFESKKDAIKNILNKCRKNK